MNEVLLKVGEDKANLPNDFFDTATRHCYVVYEPDPHPLVIHMLMWRLKRTL